MKGPGAWEDACETQPGLQGATKEAPWSPVFPFLSRRDLFGAEIWMFKHEAFQVFGEKVGVGRVEKKGGRLPLKVTNGEKDL